MTKDSDYFKVIEYLQKFQNDSEFHDVENLLGESKEYKTSKHYQTVIKRLLIDRLIETKTGSGGYGLPPMRINGEPIGEYDSSYRPKKARITLEGLKKYSELMAIQKPQMNIEINDSPNAIVGQGEKINQQSSPPLGNVNPANNPNKKNKKKYISVIVNILKWFIPVAISAGILYFNWNK